MTISEMIKSFDQLSEEEQKNLLKILCQRHSQMIDAENLADDSELKGTISSDTAKTETVDNLKTDIDTKKKNFWVALQKFRNRVDLESLDDNTFDNLRDKSPGRDVIL